MDFLDFLDFSILSMMQTCCMASCAASCTGEQEAVWILNRYRKANELIQFRHCIGSTMLTMYDRSTDEELGPNVKSLSM